MQGTYEAFGIPEPLSVTLCVAVFAGTVATFIPGVEIANCKIPSMPPKWQNACRIAGPVLFFVLLAGYYPAWNAEPSVDDSSQVELTNVPAARPLPELVDSEPEVEGILEEPSTFKPLQPEWVTFKEIPELARKISTFSVASTPPPNVDLIFETDCWPIYMQIKPTLSMRVGHLKSALVAQFNLMDNVQFDLSRFPAGRGWWTPEFVLTANGRELEDVSTLRGARLVDGDTIRLVVSWSIRVPVTANSPPPSENNQIRPPRLEL